MLKNLPYNPFVPLDVASAIQVEHAFFRTMRAIVNAEDNMPNAQNMRSILRILGAIGLRRWTHPDKGADTVFADKDGIELIASWAAMKEQQRTMWSEVTAELVSFHTVVLLTLNEINSGFHARLMNFWHHGNRVAPDSLRWRSMAYSLPGNAQAEVRETVLNVLEVLYPHLVPLFGHLEVDGEGVTFPFTQSMSDEDKKGIAGFACDLNEDYSSLYVRDDDDEEDGEDD